MTQENLPDYIVHFMKPESHDPPVTGVQLIQTHISYVLVLDQDVYKFKKPVDFGFLDFSTLDKRAYFCEQEVELNRRLCPEIYLGRVGVHRVEDGYRLGSDAGAVEYGVRMARMDESRMMGRVMAADGLREEHLDAIVEKLVPFYESAGDSDEIKTFGLPEKVGVNVIENFDQTESFIGGGALEQEQFDCIRNYATGVLGEADRFQRRISDGRIRDCHGDLYSANICLDDNVHIFDCIEFNDRLRYSDVAGDIGFLAMDLDYHGFDKLSDYFVARYVERSEDDGILDLITFYQCYRAYVRGKISLFTAADPAVDARTTADCTEQATRYFRLAAHYAEKDT